VYFCSFVSFAGIFRSCLCASATIPSLFQKMKKSSPKLESKSVFSDVRPLLLLSPGRNNFNLGAVFPSRLHSEFSKPPSPRLVAMKIFGVVAFDSIISPWGWIRSWRCFLSCLFSDYRKYRNRSRTQDGHFGLMAIVPVIVFSKQLWSSIAFTFQLTNYFHRDSNRGYFSECWRPENFLTVSETSMWILGRFGLYLIELRTKITSIGYKRPVSIVSDCWLDGRGSIPDRGRGFFL
jgi:hypothetical protein